MNAWTRGAATLALAAVALMSGPARADYTYTFNTAAIGTVAFSTPTLIAANQRFSSYSIVYTTGTASSASFTQDTNFDLTGGTTSTGYRFSQYGFNFDMFPAGVGMYNAPFSGTTFAFYSDAGSGPGTYTSGTLTIAFVPPVASTVPEPMSLALLATGVGVALLRRRR